MRKLLIGAMLMTTLSVPYVRGEMVTSSKYGGIIKELPTVGQIVKKGQMLVVFSQTGTNAEIDAIKADIEISKEELSAKALDMNRSNMLLENHTKSKKEWEDARYGYNSARYKIQKNNAQLAKLESDKAHCFIPAPYDCRILRVLLVPNSGTDIGQPILEVERVDDSNKVTASEKTGEHPIL